MLRGNELFSRLTTDEAAAIAGADAPSVRRFVQMYRDKPRPADRLDQEKRQLVSLGLLTQERADAVFAE